MQQVEGGDYTARVTPSGAGELRTLVGGFNDMATLVEAQRDRLQALAESDPLTGLANHRRFHQALEDTIGAARSAAVVALDLDHFKFLNDTRGHPYGDQVLREVAAKLREAVRGAHDLVGRLGGEEFGILLADVDAEEAFRVAERARGLIRGLPIDGFSLDCSAGVAAWPTDTDSPARLLDLADAALYQAKRMGRGQTRRVDADSGEAAVDQQRAAVRRLLDDPQLITPVFQPIVDLATGRVAGYEGAVALPGRGRPARPTSGSTSRAAAASGRCCRRWRCGACSRCPAGRTAPGCRSTSTRARSRRTPSRARCPQRPRRDRDRDHRAGAPARRRGAAGDPRRPARRAARRSRSTTPARATRACSTWCASGRRSSSSTAASCAGSTRTPSGSR